ncbi:MAG: hypothetical protein MZW92_38905 [Comamonadaceae bacterium]|nr:hypothetical protein [Comamonadaceae bacterium]
MQRIEAILRPPRPRLRARTGPSARSRSCTPPGRLCEALARGDPRRRPGCAPQLSTTGGTSDGRFIADDLPAGGRVRPAERDHPQDRRAHRAWPTSSR